jgi:hypothetical protein
MTGCGCMSGGKRRRTRRRSRRTKRKMSKHHRRRSSRHRRSRRSRRTRRRRGGKQSINSAIAAHQGVSGENPTMLLTGGTKLAPSDFAPSDNKVSGGYKKKKRGGTTTKTHLHPE